jgi:hypothetical protein
VFRLGLGWGHALGNLQSQAAPLLACMRRATEEWIENICKIGFGNTRPGILYRYDSDFFYRALAAVAILAPILLVFVAGTLPEGVERGELIVYGHGVVLAILATALVLRAMYRLGFSKAFKLAVSEPNRPVTA